LELFKGLKGQFAQWMKKMGSESTLDYELKYVFNKSVLDLVLTWINSFCLPDPLYLFGRVSSVYFDTRKLRSLEEKVNSDYIRSKFRIRWYSTGDPESPDDISFLEIKRKIGTTRKKRRIECHVSGKYLAGADLTADAYLGIASILRAEGELFGENLFPLFQIDYKRWRFVEPLSGMRLCVDCDISVPKVNESIFPNPLPLFLENGVLEIKGSLNELPEVLNPLTFLGCRKESFSKYRSCFEKLNAFYRFAWA